MDYVANTADMFRVNAFGDYTVTLDLSDGLAKVTIEMVSLKVTSFELSIADNSKAYLQYICAEEGAAENAARTMYINAYTVPEFAQINPADVTVTTDPSVSEYVSITHEVTTVAVDPTDPEITRDYLSITLTLLKAPEENMSFQLNVVIDNHEETFDNPSDNITITILADGETYTAVSSISFTSDYYLVNVNNGAKPWISSTPIEATVNEGASVTGVGYFTDSDHVYIEYLDVDPSEEVENLKPFVHANAIGTYTIYAYALGNRELEPAKVEVLVTSLIVPNENGEIGSDTTSGFYLIGILDGVEVEGWTSIVPEKQNFEGSDFAEWQLPLPTFEEGQEITKADLETYSGEFHFKAGDRMSIAFLGMNGDWDGIINEQYFDWANAYGNFYESMGNIEFTISGYYRVTLNLGGTAPSFTVRLTSADDVNAEYRIYYYIVRSGDSWDPTLNDQENTLAEIGYINMLDGVAQGNFVYTNTTDKAAVINFYSFYTTTGAWPNIQFVSAVARNYNVEDNHGLDDGYFLEATWYGSSYEGIEFTGTAYYKAPDEPDPDEEPRYNYFTNYLTFSELFWVGDENAEITSAMAGRMTVSFTITLDATTGVLKGVELNFVTTSTEPAE